jgi:hypothetical protein
VELAEHALRRHRDPVAKAGKLDSADVSQSLPRRIVGVHRRRPGADRSGSQTLAKGLTLLELVADRQGGYGVGLVELSKELC